LAAAEWISKADYPGQRNEGAAKAAPFFSLGLTVAFFSTLTTALNSVQNPARLQD
jgi:hypothetical protein